MGFINQLPSRGARSVPKLYQKIPEKGCGYMTPTDLEEENWCWHVLCCNCYHMVGTTKYITYYSCLLFFSISAIFQCFCASLIFMSVSYLFAWFTPLWTIIRTCPMVPTMFFADTPHFSDTPRVLTSVISHRRRPRQQLRLLHSGPGGAWGWWFELAGGWIFKGKSQSFKWMMTGGTTIFFWKPP